jgi:hypothetical protein
LGYLAFQLATQSEQDLAESRFEGIAERALTMAQLVLDKKKWTTDSLAHVTAAVNPYADKWPNVSIQSFKEITTSLELGMAVFICTNGTSSLVRTTVLIHGLVTFALIHAERASREQAYSRPEQGSLY